MAWWKCKGGFRGYINITSTANATVTATTGSNSYSAVCDASGAAQIKVKKKGTYTVSSTGTYRLAHAMVSDRTPVTAQYQWQKWNSILTYSQSSYSVGAEATFWGGSWVSSWNFGTGYSFDTSTGQFTINGGSSSNLRTDSQRNSVTWNNAPYCGYPNTYSPSSNVCSQIAYPNDSNSTIKANSSGFLAPAAVFGSTGGANVLYATGTYHKGSTQYDNSQSASLTGYPTNGRHSDGYWYIAI